MRIQNIQDEKNPFYVGKCKGNQEPKHLAKEGVETKKVKIDKKPATLFNSPKTQYTYIKCGENWLWVKGKEIFEHDGNLTTTKIVREKAQETEQLEAVES